MNENHVVKFVSYNGSYPTLCFGKLILNLDGKDVEFPSDCLSSGGGVYFDEDWDAIVESGEWRITDWPDGWPESAKESAEYVVNANVESGCCGGCI